MMDTTCPNCGHDKPDHSNLMGCLGQDDAGDPCPCTRSFPEAAKTVETARAEGLEAQEHARQGTDPNWADSAVKALQTLRARSLGTGGTFTPDDVWEMLEEMEVPPPREPRALGPILKAMSSGDAATIRSVGFTESRRRHGAPVRIYEARRP